jgi:hypothetical protein
MTYDVQREHNCNRRHLTWATAAQCIWPRAATVDGDGRYAVLTNCGVMRVALWRSPAAAERQMALYDRGGCGRRCTGDHSIAEITVSARGLPIAV